MLGQLRLRIRCA